MAKKLQITLKRSLIGRTPKQRATTAALGLRKINQVVIHPDNPAIRGMIDKVKHMVEVKEIEE
ncbi:MAG: 50S ribosomal protein L30 [Bacillus thermozeamaize]|jgi:large subunit ribosomal protein L30|uniref:Large ribosomal subunit protein uL30 n=1 Tax=Bacillus thermozeamaize TaxID=230954 RepID=A0A1Y3PKU7_9BACI|nr:MAG: 50S ribosomal protein L30 [Bacillus thermozeamaize]